MNLARSIVLLLLVGCADTHQVIRSSTTGVSLSRQATAYVAIPNDGSYEKIVYAGSGAIAAQSIAAAFAPYLAKVTVALKIEDLGAARRSARANGFTYVIFPQILHWEDRATEWSGRPDVASVKVSVVGVDSGEVIDSAVIGGQSGLGTLGGDRPEHLLPKPLGEYAGSLFRP